MMQNLTQRLMWVLWPSFLTASVAVGLFFSCVDPGDIHIFGAPIEVSRMTAYSVGFFAFWALGAISSYLSCMLAQSPFEVNRCTLEPGERPPGCPKRPDEACCE